MEKEHFFVLLERDGLLIDYHTESYIIFNYFVYPECCDHVHEGIDPSLVYLKVDKVELAKELYERGWSVERIEKWFSQSDSIDTYGGGFRPLGDSAKYRGYIHFLKERETLKSAFIDSDDSIASGVIFF